MSLHTFPLVFVAIALLGVLAEPGKTQDKAKSEGAAYEGKAVSQWVELLVKSETLDVRRNACAALYHIGPEAKDVVPALAKALKDEESSVRTIAANALSEIGPDAVPVWVDALKAQDVVIRRKAALTLVGIDASTFGKDAAPVLIEALKDDDRNVRTGAANALGRIGPTAKDAVPALREVVKENSPGSDKAKAALNRIDK